jgi:hypothetical protein
MGSHKSEESYQPMMSERPPLKEQATDHLRKALDADDPDTKNFHIRSALQFEECIEATEQADHAHAD